MKILIFGPPGSGKGTMAEKLNERFEIQHISTGDIFRENIKNQTKLGKKVKEYLDNGKLVPDDLTNEIVKARLSQEDCKKGFILDGYPRTLEQAKYLANISEIDFLIKMDPTEEVIMERLSGRRTCKNCGKVYHIKNAPSKMRGTCDDCGGKLYQRDDDKPNVIIKRIEEYEEKSEPVIKFYEEERIPIYTFHIVDAEIPIEVNRQRLVSGLIEKGLIKT